MHVPVTLPRKIESISSIIINILFISTLLYEVIFPSAQSCSKSVFKRLTSFLTEDLSLFAIQSLFYHHFLGLPDSRQVKSVAWIEPAQSGKKPYCTPRVSQAPSRLPVNFMTVVECILCTAGLHSGALVHKMHPTNCFSPQRTQRFLFLYPL